MKKVLIILLVTIVFAAVSPPVFANDLSFHEEEIATFEKIYAARSAWARLFAWGEGTYEGADTSFEWVAWCNTDGYLQISLSVPLEGHHITHMETYENAENENTWKVNSHSFVMPDENDQLIATGKGHTWIGVNQDWINEDCQYQKQFGWQCSNNKVIDKAIANMNNKLPFISDIKVIEYLDQ